MKLTIRNKMLFAFFTLIMSMVILQLIFSHFLAEAYYVQVKSSVMEEGYQELVTVYDGSVESVQAATQEYELEHGINYIVIGEKGTLYSSRDSETNKRYGYEVQDNPPKMPELHAQIRGIPWESLGEGAIVDGETLYLSQVFAYGEETIRCFMMLPMISIRSSAATLSQSNMWIALVATLIGAILAFVFSRSITKPIREMEQVAGKLAELDFMVRANENTSSLELRSLANSLNTMSEKLEDTIARLHDANNQLEQELEYHKQLECMQRDFMGNVSHEMKTPLALLQLYAANLKSQIPGIDKEYYYDIMIEEASRISEMVSSMLTMSSVESGLYEMVMDQFSFSELCNSLIMKLEPLLEEFQVTIEVETNLEVVGDSKYLEQAMKNYMTNAIAHTKPNGRIIMKASSSQKHILFQVSNEGENIALEEIDAIWNSFYRSDKARVRRNHNVGLGLSIVRTIIEKHGGMCGVENIENGVSFYFTIPS